MNRDRREHLGFRQLLDVGHFPVFKGNAFLLVLICLISFLLTSGKGPVLKKSLGLLIYGEKLQVAVPQAVRKPEGHGRLLHRDWQLWLTDHKRKEKS